MAALLAMSDKSPQPTSRRQISHHVVMVAFEDAQVIDITGPLEVFARTARWLADHRGVSPPAYTIEITARTVGPLRTSGGIVLHADRALADVREADTILIAGGIGYQHAIEDECLLNWLKGATAKADRVGSICTGSLILAAAGMLEGRRATTHWAYGKRLRELAPTATIEPDSIFVRDGRVFTSAGVTAGMDLALALVEEDWGRATALAVAQELVLYLKRPGGQSQFSRLLEAQRRDDRFGLLESWILDHLADHLTVSMLAEWMAMSVRQFSRRFSAEMGMSPARFIERLRVEHARQSLSEGKRSFKAVARQCGFGDEQRMRRAFQRHLGITPVEYQQRFC